MTPDVSLFEAALSIARSRAHTLELLRRALEQNDNAAALSIARRLTGLTGKQSKEERPAENGPQKGFLTHATPQ
jgi:hypothetical protein